MAIGTAAVLAAGAKKYGVKVGINTLGNLIGGSVMGLFSSNSAAKAAERQYKYNLALQQQQQQWNEYMYKHRYQFQRSDMEAAGINPLFGLGQAPTVTSGLNSTSMADDVGQQNNRFNALMSILDFGQNLSAKRAQTKLLENQALTEEQNTLLRTAEVLEKQISNKFLPKMKKQELLKMQADTLEALAKTNESYANAKLTGAYAARANLENKPLERYEKFVRKNPKLAKIIENTDRMGISTKAFLGILKNGGTGLRYLINR